MDLTAIGAEHPSLSGAQTALDLRPLTRSAAGSRTQSDSRRATSEPPSTDRVEISPVARSLAQAATGVPDNSGGSQQGQDLKVDFLPPIMRSVLVRLSDRFYQTPGIEEQLARQIESAFSLQPPES